MKTILFTIFLIISWSANAGILDRFKDPADLIMNQRNCSLGNANGEILDGKFIVNRVAVLAYLRKLDKNRITFQLVGDDTSLVLTVYKNDGLLGAALNENKVLINCHLGK